MRQLLEIPIILRRIRIDGLQGSREIDMILDTGAMYRMVAYYFLKEKIELISKKSVLEAISKISLDIEGEKFFLNREDVSQKIRTPEVTGLVSQTAAIKEVREKLVELQREIAQGKNSILDGRDIGTTVFPSADVKIFLVASAEERAKRRVADYKEKGIEGESFEDVMNSIKERDYLDSTREESPLKKAEDAIEIDTSLMNIEEVCNEVSKYIEGIKE